MATFALTARCHHNAWRCERLTPGLDRFDPRAVTPTLPVDSGEARAGSYHDCDEATVDPALGRSRPQGVEVMLPPFPAGGSPAGGAGRIHGRWGFRS